MKKIFLLHLILLFTISCFSQEISNKQIRKKMKAKEIVFNDYHAEKMVLAKMKNTKKWGLYSIYSGMEIDDFSYEEVIAPKFDSLSFFGTWDRFQIVKQKDKYGVLLLPYEIEDAADRVNCKFDKIIHKKVDGEDYILIKESDKWGLIDWFEGFYIVDPIFDTPEEVPLIKMESWMVETFKLAKTKLNADLVIFDPNNGDGALKARSKITKKWGMYQFLDMNMEVKELIPMQYDSLNFYPFNGKYTAVYNNGKVGFYLSYWSYDEQAKQTVACAYEDYKRFDTDGVSKLAVKKNGKWGWVDWLTGEEKSEFTYNSTDDLPYPRYKQNYWFDD
ncbi:WG repeat-containing protein [Ulvibacter sp.]|nr:WG repeat-containing protein [Ulvibacter sp.]